MINFNFPNRSISLAGPTQCNVALRKTYRHVYAFDAFLLFICCFFSRHCSTSSSWFQFFLARNALHGCMCGARVYPRWSKFTREKCSAKSWKAMSRLTCPGTVSMFLFKNVQDHANKRETGILAVSCHDLIILLINFLPCSFGRVYNAFSSAWTAFSLSIHFLTFRWARPMNIFRGTTLLNAYSFRCPRINSSNDLPLVKKKKRKSNGKGGITCTPTPVSRFLI